MKKETIAIDVGYGWTKMVTDYNSQTNTFKELIFPSQSAYSFCEDTAQSDLDQTDVVVVKIDEQFYVAGVDISLHQQAYHTQVLTNDYVHTKQYLTLNLAALAYSGATEIENLVIGLPVDLAQSKKEFVTNLLIGEHQINSTIKVTVKNVIIMAQPVGGLIYANSIKEIEFNDQHKYLIIDPGYFTFDYIVFEGKKRNKELCGHYPGGMNSLLKAIAKVISHDQSVHYQDYNSIDKGLRTSQFYLNNKKLSLSKYLKLAMPCIEPPIQAMLNQIGDSRDFNKIIVVGGGANIYSKILKLFLPPNLITQMDNPMLANARGFFLFGRQLNKTKGVKAS